MPDDTQLRVEQIEVCALDDMRAAGLLQYGADEVRTALHRQPVGGLPGVAARLGQLADRRDQLGGAFG